MTTTTAAVVFKTGDPFVLDEVELTDLRPDEVLVRMIATGICHADISAARGVIPYPLPGVLGHEGTGIVEAIGSHVKRAAVGDKVLLSFTSCGLCANCRAGHPAYCLRHLELNLLGGRRADGSATLRQAGKDLNAHFFGQSSFSRISIVDERSVYVLPSDVTESEMAVLAPLGCGLQTGAGAVLNVLKPRPGTSIAITGAGAVGLAAVMATRFTAVAKVIVVDIVQSRLDLALELGATDVVDGSKGDVEGQLLALTGGLGLDYAIETSGNVGVLEAVIESLGVGGRCAIIGAPPVGSRASFNVNKHLPGRVIQGITMGDSEPQTFIPVLIDAYRRGEFPLDRLERTYAFEDINEAVADASSGATIKPVLVF